MVISYRNREYALGGAGNAAYNLAALGVEVEAVGVVGRDETGRDVRRLLRRAGIADGSILAEQEFATPLKTRILAGEETRKSSRFCGSTGRAKFRGSSRSTIKWDLF